MNPNEIYQKTISKFDDPLWNDKLKFIDSLGDTDVILFLPTGESKTASYYSGRISFVHYLRPFQGFLVVGVKSGKFVVFDEVFCQYLETIYYLEKMCSDFSGIRYRMENCWTNWLFDELW